MNSDWQKFISQCNGMVTGKLEDTYPADNHNQPRLLYPLAHFGALHISGADASSLLQGQTTCDVFNIGPTQSKLAAMCNPKGRVIATFLLARTDEAFLLILPVELVETVQRKLQMYVLRSDVKISNVSDQYGFLGISQTERSGKDFDTAVENGLVAVFFPGKSARKLLVGPADQLIRCWDKNLASGEFYKADSTLWRLQDLMAGLPWLTLATSEEFIPQMLNLDKMGGVSFTKGCYTGQEIVARTHYLGKNKREMFLAECDAKLNPELEPAPNSAVIMADDTDQQAAGHVLVAHRDNARWKLLLVLQASATDRTEFRLRDFPEVQLQLIPYS